MNKFGVLFVFALAIAVTTAQEDTTTAAPTTAPTTKPAPVTTVAPTPAPDHVTANTSCVRMEMKGSFNLSYKDADEKVMFESFDIPFKGVKVSGDCGDDIETVILSFNTDNVSDATITFTFNKTGSDYKLAKVDAVATMFEKFPASAVSDDLDLFHTSVDSSYSCMSKQVVTFANSTGSATLTNAQVQAFMKNTASFSSGVECPEDAKTSNIVPIAVGASLAALVVIVLIAYLISRKRNQRGYESV